MKKTYDFKNALVIGGAGMLGYEIAVQLAKKGKKVKILDLQSANDPRFEEILGDIRNIEDVNRACSRVDIVFQTAAEVWNPGRPSIFYEEVNIMGNRNVIDACIKMGVGRLVYSSTLDVVVDGRKPIVDGDESLPYPKKEPKDPYCRTKIKAEKLILESNNRNLLTCALRPVGMYGPRDKYHIANIIKAASEGSDFRLGNGRARFSHVYSENAAHAHILAAKHLYDGSPVAGNYYFIADHYPAQNLFDFMEPFLKGLGLDPPKKTIPYPVAYILGWLNEKINPDSNFNRFAVIQTCIDHTFVHKKAFRDFGYEPIVSKEEAFRRTLEWFKDNMENIY
jgi:sterol-4alpha-carboxylate 3-dehydrogenase (decarboxylating)